VARKDREFRIFVTKIKHSNSATKKPQVSTLGLNKQLNNPERQRSQRGTLSSKRIPVFDLGKSGDLP
jgi:hypothetical protein